MNIIPWMWVYPWRVLFGTSFAGSVCSNCKQIGHLAESCKHSQRVEP